MGPRDLYLQRKRTRLGANVYADPTAICSITVCTARRTEVFANPELAAASAQLLRNRATAAGVSVHAYCFMPDHVHLCLSIPPKYSVANAVGRLKGKSAIRIHREYLGRVRNFTGLHFWARGYCVSTVGLDEEMIRKYLRNQEQQEQRAEQLMLGDFSTRRPS